MQTDAELMSQLKSHLDQFALLLIESDKVILAEIYIFLRVILRIIKLLPEKTEVIGF